MADMTIRYDWDSGKMHRTLPLAVKKILNGGLSYGVNSMRAEHARDINPIYLQLDSDSLADILYQKDLKGARVGLIDLRPNGIDNDKVIGTLFRPFEISSNGGVKLMHLPYTDIDTRAKIKNNDGALEFIHGCPDGILLACRFGTVSAMMQGKFLDYAKAGLFGDGFSRHNIVDAGGFHDYGTANPDIEFVEKGLVRFL